MAYQSLAKQKEKPSKATKDRLTRLVEQNINECGKISKYLVRHSGSREVSDCMWGAGVVSRAIRSLAC